MLAARCAAEPGYSLYSYDVASGSVEDAEYLDVGGRYVEDLAWRDDSGLGYAAVTAGTGCDGLVKIEDGGISLFTEFITLDGATWTLDQFSARQLPRDDACTAVGQARNPFVVGPSVYFAASGQARGISGRYARWSAQTSVLRMDLPEGTPTTLVDGFIRVRDLAVTPAHLARHRQPGPCGLPNGNRLVVSRTRDGVESTWLVNLDDGNVTNLGVAVVTSLSISPAGDQVVVMAHGAVFHAL